MKPVIDFHSHILPGIDDGSRNIQESLEMLRKEAEHGVRYVVATPHFYGNHDSLERFLYRRADAVTKLKEAMAGQENLPRLIIGAEVYYFPGISESDALPELTIGSRKAVLVEMPHGPWTQVMYQELEDIYSRRGIIPIVAHVDRYISPLQTHRIPQRLEELPVMVQANAEFFLNRTTAGMALRMLKKGQIHLLGTDCHNMKSRMPNLEPALRLIEERLGSGAIDHIRTHERMILADRA